MNTSSGRKLQGGVVALLIFFSLTFMVGYAREVSTIQAAETTAVPLQPVAKARWSNSEGKVIEASYEGMDGPDHVLLRSVDGLIYRYAMTDLSHASRRLAKAGGIPKLLHWANAEGKTMEASFDSMDGPGHVLLRQSNGKLHRYPIANLAPESRLQALVGDSLLPLSVVFIGDSMSLGGFGKRLDQHLRASTGIDSVHTYMACGTSPLSWIMGEPYNGARTNCGYWSIESVSGAEKPRELVDIYGMSEGHKPSSHPVPKLENLLESAQPDVLVIQSGNNLFSAFSDGKTIREDYHAELIRSQITPLIALLESPISSLRKVYWVTPPQTGSVADEVQEFVYRQICVCAGPAATVIDSRKFCKYPYKQMSADKEHFSGSEALAWADRTYEQLAQDLFSRPVWSYPLLKGMKNTQANSSEANAVRPRTILHVKARLLSKTKFPGVGTFAPYQEIMVGFRYELIEVIEGRYEPKQILVMHPAYIRLKKQQGAEELEIGRIFDLRLQRLGSDSLWSAVRRVDDASSYDLDAYLLVEDELRHPDASTKEFPRGHSPPRWNQGGG